MVVLCGGSLYLCGGNLYLCGGNLYSFIFFGGSLNNFLFFFGGSLNNFQKNGYFANYGAPEGYFA